MNQAPRHAVFRVIHPGPRTSLQDAGRRAVKSMGIPQGGAMDQGLLMRLNQLFDQHPHTAAYEMLWAGLQLECLCDAWVAYGGSAQALLDSTPLAAERTILVRKGQSLRFHANADGLWSYLSMAGGWCGDSWFGSQSVWPEGEMGACLREKDLLCMASLELWQPPAGIAARFLRPQVYNPDHPIRVHQGPQWREFSPSSKQRFFETTWQVSIQSNRAGFRLQGEKLEVPSHQLISEPTLLGSIQVPTDGQPIVLLNDGPTIGGYHKIAVIHRDDLDRFRQTSPGQHLRFSLLS